MQAGGRQRIGIWIMLRVLPCLLAPNGAFAATDSRMGDRPYMGWSSWSLEATKHPGYGGENWLTADHLKTQAEIVHRLLQKHGYLYINIDSGWKGGYDAFGRPLPDTRKFPGGIPDVARYVHRLGLKLGIYYTPGIDENEYKLNKPIYHTPYHLQDIAVQPVHPSNGWGGGVKIDYSKPGSQEYINSIAEELASWGVDFLKLDGVTPGSDHNDLKIDARPDVAAWAKALHRLRRPIWLEISWNLDHDYADYWKQYANGRRIDDDVETYGPTLTAWRPLALRFQAAAKWAADAGKGLGWNDLDSLEIGSGDMDGLSDEERQTMMTLWAIACSPLYSGDDLTKLDAIGLKLLTNDEVIAVDQEGHPGSPVVEGNQPVWVAHEPDGSLVVALFNLDGKNSAVVAVSWDILGLHGSTKIRDVWSHTNLGEFHDSFSATLPPHGSRLLKFSAN